MKCITSLVLFLIAPVGLAQGVPKEALIYSVSGYNTDHHSQLHGDLGNASTNAR